MNIDQHLERLRSKPSHVKKRIAFWSSFGMTAIIFAFWIGSFSGAPQSAVAKSAQKTESPGKALVAGVGSLFVDVKELVFGSKKVEFSSLEVLPKN